MHRIVLTLFVSLTFAACSTRVEYKEPVHVYSSRGVNINTATVDELEKLGSIGRKTAESIVRHRAEHGPFRRVEHLMLIRGVSESRFNALRNSLRVTDE